MFDQALKTELNTRIVFFERIYIIKFLKKRENGENPQDVMAEVLYKKKMSEYANYGSKNRFLNKVIIFPL